MLNREAKLKPPEIKKSTSLSVQFVRNSAEEIKVVEESISQR